MNVLVLCHGNINRSPAAAAVLATYQGVEVRSAGLKDGAHGPAAKKMRDAMEALGYDLSEHRARPAEDDDVEWADMVIVMDNGNVRRFQEQFPDHVEKVRRLGGYASPPVPRVPDPAFMKRGAPEFEATVRMINQAAINLGRALAIEAQPRSA